MKIIILIFCVIVVRLPMFSGAAEHAGVLITRGLMVDLDADKSVVTDDEGRVVRWSNQVAVPGLEHFEKSDSGRSVANSGCPSIRKNVPEINGHHALVFREQELTNFNEDVLDPLITGSGYTFFCLLKPFKQDGKLADVNSFMGNLRNGGKYEGIWGGLTDDNRAWAGVRNGITFGRWDVNNPFIASHNAISEQNYSLIIGKMDAGKDSANVYLMINEWNEKEYVRKVQVNPAANSSMLAIGQERFAVEHPGVESFDGEIARFLLYGRSLSAREIKSTIATLNNTYRFR